MAQHELITKMYAIAKKSPKKIVVCEGWDERTIKATAEIVKEGLAHIILLGKPSEIHEKAKRLGADTSKIKIIDHLTDPVKKELVEKFVELRKHKGMTQEEAEKLMQDVNYFGCMYAYAGHVDGVAGSTICSTAQLMRPALQILKKKGSLASQIIIEGDVKKGNRPIFFTDGSLNINPTPEELAQIGTNAIETVRLFGIEPKVAFLSYSTAGSGGDGEDLKSIRKAVELCKAQNPGVIIDGEMQGDASVNPDAARRKCPDSPLKGDANILVTPNLMSGNILAHCLNQFASMDHLLGMVAGTLKPVSILGRSSTPEMIKNFIVSAAMQANAEN